MTLLEKIKRIKILDVSSPLRNIEPASLTCSLSKICKAFWEGGIYLLVRSNMSDRKAMDK